VNSFVLGIRLLTAKSRITISWKEHKVMLTSNNAKLSEVSVLKNLHHLVHSSPISEYFAVRHLCNQFKLMGFEVACLHTYRDIPFPCISNFVDLFNRRGGTNKGHMSCLRD
jgi:hypothetical protein